MNKSVFSKGKEKILGCFYKNKTKELYFSEILRETKLTQNTTLRHLEVLKKENLILSTKKIGNTYYKINPKNIQIYSLFSYFDYKKFNELPNVRKRAISEFLDKVEEKPLISLIFGSTAKGTFSKESDIDLLLIYNKKGEQQEKLKREIEAITGNKIQTFIIDYGYFKEQLLREEDKVLLSAIKTGFVMTGHYFFYNGVLR